MFRLLVVGINDIVVNPFKLCCEYLRLEGHEVFTLNDYSLTLQMIQQTEPMLLVIFDDENRIDFIDDIHMHHQTLPILILTQKGPLDSLVNKGNYTYCLNKLAKAAILTSNVRHILALQRDGRTSI